VGRDLPPRGQDGAPPPHAPVVLRVDGLGRRPHFEDVSLEVRAGEIVALFGLVGSGRSALLECLFGVRRPERGTIALAGRALVLRSPREAGRAGVALAPEERQAQGLFFNLGLRDNLALPREWVRGALLLRRGREREQGQALLQRWGIKAAGLEAAPHTLSGGNQQKVVLAKWLAIAPRLLLLDEPTKGVDVGAKYEIHELVRQQAAAGTACLLASSDLPEVLALAHRIVVMREGRIQGELAAAGADEEQVMHLATAQQRDAS
jgi:rhamnose transport system ATP-binding protein